MTQSSAVPPATPRRYRLDMAYVGQGFQGWQSQPNKQGIQDHLEAALATFLRSGVRLVGSSRTDTGVHAEHQVATFETDVTFSSHRLLRALHALLPPQIGIRSVSEVRGDFHPILSAKGKAYRYRLWRSEAIDPFFSPYVWKVPATIDLEAMRREATTYLGMNDFTSFCAVDSTAKTRQREIYEVVIDERGPLVDIWVLGSGFLKQMVRSMVGTLVEFGEGKRQGDSVAAILESRDRTRAGKTAPAQGLCLVRVFYEEPVMSAATLIGAAERGFCVALPFN